MSLSQSVKQALDDDSLVICLALKVLQLNVEGLSAAKQEFINIRVKEALVDVICLQDYKITQLLLRSSCLKHN